MTWGDKIRAMTDEELAKEFEKARIYIYLCGQLNAKTESLPTDYECWLDWLRKEVQE